MDEAPTKIDRPAPREVSASVVTPEQAVALIEARRAWMFSLGLAVTCVVGVPLIVIMGGDRTAQLAHLVSVAATGIACVIHVIDTRDPRRHRRWKAIAVTVVSIFANATGYWYWGAFSAYLAAVPVSAYMFASGSGQRDASYVVVSSVVSHVGIGLAQIYGWTDAAPLFSSPSLSPPALIALLIVLQGMVLAALAGGNDAHRTMQRVIADHNNAMRALAVRDAQLAEAFEAARDARGPDEGRFSGQQLGRFKLGAILGRGAMGEVYAADDDRGAPCAVKVLAVAMLGNDDAVRRFQREARVIASIDAPNIVKMIDVSPASSPLPYFAMERLSGRDLGDLVKEQPVRDVAEVVTLVRAIAAGLDVAHDAGVVHRDLKPANVFAASTGGSVTWKILDFGVSKVFAPDATLTAGQVVGTPGYMAPEQARGEAVDRRADVYSLGVIVYRLLTGRPAIIPGDVPAMLHEVVYRMPPAPSSITAVPPELEAVLAVALAKSPDDRFARAGELATALADAAAGKLSPDVRERADAILGKTPWGAWVRGRKKTVAM